MAQIENMTPEDVSAFDAFVCERKKLNESLEVKKFEMTDMDIAKKLDKVSEEVERLSAKIDRIFGKAVLLDGRFVTLR